MAWKLLLSLSIESAGGGKADIGHAGSWNWTR